MPPDEPPSPARLPRDDVPDDLGVVDRIVDGQTAVVLVGSDQTEHHLSADQLPDGVSEGTWLRVTFDAAGQVDAVMRDDAATDAAAQAAQEQLGRIRDRQTGGRFG